MKSDSSVPRATHGPWYVAESKGGKRYVYGADNNPIFVTNESSTKQHRPTATERNANLRLISFAPELLSALKVLYEETADYIKINHLGEVHHNRSMQLARDAIAKAEGR